VGSAWDEYRDVLASTLKTQEWSDVERVVSALRQIEGNLKRAAAAEGTTGGKQRTEVRLDTDTAGRMLAVADQARRAFDALAKIADEPVADDSFGQLIGPSAQ
jgi:hypothetical protein